MIKNKKPTILDCVEDIFKAFVNKYGEIEISENINPSFVMFIVAILGISRTFLLVIKDSVCPKCGKKLHRHERVDFYLNNTIHMKKMKYKCSDDDCGCVVTPKWNRFIEAGCNYTIAVKEFALELGLICNISYERMSEIIYWAHGVKISRTTLYKFKKEKFDEYVSKMREDLKKYREEFKKEFSDVLAYDEQYVYVKNEWMLKLTALDPNSGHVFDFCIATKKEFNREYVKNFLKPIIDEFKIDTVVTDGAKIYPSIMNELNVKHKLCNFHKMQALMRRILGKIVSFNNKIRNLEVKIEENKKRIEEIKKLRKNKMRRASKEEQALVDEKHELERQNHQYRRKIREHKKEQQLYIDIKDAVSLMLKSKAKKTGLNRYAKIMDNIDDVPKEARAFVKNISKELDSLLLHAEDHDIPTTNNLIELYHLTTLNRRDKKKYKTISGVMEDTFLATMRWEQRVVLCID